MSNIFIGLKKTCLGVLERGERDNDYETGLKERGGIEMSNYSASITRCTLSSLYLPCKIWIGTVPQQQFDRAMPSPFRTGH